MNGLLPAKGAQGSMRLESEVRRSAIVEQHFVHGKWKIIKVYIKGELREVIVRSMEGYHA